MTVDLMHQKSWYYLLDRQTAELHERLTKPVSGSLMSSILRKKRKLRLSPERKESLLTNKNLNCEESALTMSFAQFFE